MVYYARWTEQEKEFVLNNIGTKSYGEIGKLIDRTAKSVKNVACREGVNYFTCSNFYSAQLLAKELGKSRYFIVDHHRKGHLKGKRAKWCCYSKRPFIFVEESIILFLKKYYHLFKAERIPNPYFRNIVKEMTQP